MPIIHNCAQGSSEWISLRSGLPTSSRFSDIITKSGKPSDSAERYLYTLLAEKLMGHPVIEHVTMWQGRGTELEAEALAFFKFVTGLESTPVGFVTNDARTYGASPDQLVAPESILEIKCPSEYQHCMMLMHSGSVHAKHFVQVQGQLMVTERKRAHMLSFHPEMPPALETVERDEAFISKMRSAVETFSLELERQFRICIERGWVAEMQERQQSASDAWSKPLPSPAEAMKELLRNAK